MKQQLSEQFKRMQKLAGILTERTSNRYEIIDSQQDSNSLNKLLDAINILNQNGLEATPQDDSGHYSGGYNHINSIYITSPVEFSQFIRKANDILANNGISHLSIIQA
jgi:hypothetical protein